MENDYVLKGNALIRSSFGMDPKELTEEQWAGLLGEAVWLEQNRLQNLSEMLSVFLGGNQRRYE